MCGLFEMRKIRKNSEITNLFCNKIFGKYLVKICKSREYIIIFKS
jgi:hypothetical protein